MIKATNRFPRYYLLEPIDLAPLDFLIVPAVTHLGSDLRVARCAERLKVGVDMRAAARERKPVMNLSRGCINAALQALLA